MSIPQRRITSRESFIDTTTSPRDAAALYFHKQLDPYYESALAISIDLFSRPQLYTAIPDGDDDNVVKLLATVRSRSGSDEYFPSRSQREDIYSPVFGPPGSSANFDKLRDDLI